MQGAWLRLLQDENGSYSEKDPTERSMDLQVEIAEKKKAGNTDSRLSLQQKFMNRFQSHHLRVRISAKA